ncbi:MAG: energy-coupling factor transporter transmembrane protein EcfT [Actinomycetota bacterium]
MRTIQFRHLERTSTLHRLRPDTKIVCLIAVSMGVALNLGWAAIAAGWTVLVGAFLLSRLPRTMLAPPPRLFLLIVGFSFMFSLFSGGDPVVGGIELGGVLEFAQLLALGLLLVGFAALLTWTTSLTDIGLGLANLLRPLRLVRAPVDELTTVIVLAVRSVPEIGSEVSAVTDAYRTRPDRTDRRGGVRGALGDMVDFSSTVVVAAHRRAGELGRAMVARGSTRAPHAPLPKRRSADLVAAAACLGGAVAAFFVF